MLRDAIRAGSLVLLTALAAVASGCDQIPDPDFSAVQTSLSLNVVQATRLSGDFAEFLLRLTNSGQRDAKACLGVSRSVSYRSPSGAGGISATFVDHSGCMRDFAIPMGGEMTWSETLEVIALSKGRVRVEVGVEIVNPRRCGGWGNCAFFEIKSSSYDIP
jgi:hypothetical protein